MASSVAIVDAAQSPTQGKSIPGEKAPISAAPSSPAPAPVGGTTPAPTGQATPRQPSIDFWCRALVGKIFDGNLFGLNRIASIIAQLEPPLPPSSSAVGSSVASQVEYPAAPKKGYVYVKNPFTSAVIQDAFRHIGSKRYTISLLDIYTALATNDLSKIVDPATLPMDPKSPLVAFCLVILYIKLVSATPETTFAIYNVLDRLRDRKVDFEMLQPGLKLDTFIRSVVERRLRFADNSLRVNLFFNELFENGQLGFLNLQKRVDNIIKEEHYGDIKTRSEKVRDAIQQQECFYRIQEYIGKSDKIVLANLRFLNEQRRDLDESIFARQSNVELLVRLIRDGIDGKTEQTETIEQALRILTKWCLYRDRNPWKQKWLLETALLVKRLFATVPSERLLPLGVMFLGTVSEVLSDKDVSEICYSVLANLMRKQPVALLQNKFLAIILYGFGSLMVNLNVDDFVDILRMMVEIWAIPIAPVLDEASSSSAVGAAAAASGSKQEMDAFLNSSAGNQPFTPPPTFQTTKDVIPSIEEQLRYLHLFATIFNGRRAKSEEKLRWARMQQQKMPVSLDQLRDQEDEWLIAASQVLKSSFMNPDSPPAVKFMSLFAGMGIFKETMKSTDSTISIPREAYESFNAMVTQAVMSNLTSSPSGSGPSSTPALSREWRRAVAVICVHIDRSLPWISDDILLELVVDVMLDDILSIQWLFFEATAAPKLELPVLMRQIEEHKQKGIYRMANIFVKATSVLFQHATSESLRAAIVFRLLSFAKRLFFQWKDFVSSPVALALQEQQEQKKQLLQQQLVPTGDLANTAAQQDPNQNPDGGLTVEKALKPILNTTFLSFSALAKLTFKYMTYEQGMMMLEAISYLEFCGQKAAPLLATVLEELVSVVAPSGNMFANKIISTYAYLVEPKKLSRSMLDGLDRMSLSRLKFLLALFEVIVARGASDSSNPAVDERPRLSALEEHFHLLQDCILPLLFLLLSHSNKPVNRKTHAVFKQIFLQDHPLKDELIPYYLKLSLDNFPDVTSFESLTETTSAILHSLPGAHPLTALTVKVLSDKIRVIKTSKNSVYLMVIMFRMIEKVDVQVLPFLLSSIDAIVRQSPKKLQVTLCKLLFKIVSSNSDYSRKEICVKWYLDLTYSVGIKHPTLVPPRW